MFTLPALFLPRVKIFKKSSISGAHRHQHGRVRTGTGSCAEFTGHKEALTHARACTYTHTHTHVHVHAHRTHSRIDRNSRHSKLEGSLIWFGSFCLPVVTNMKTRRGEWLAQCGAAMLVVASGLDRVKTDFCGMWQKKRIWCSLFCKITDASRRRVLP